MMHWKQMTLRRRARLFLEHYRIARRYAPPWRAVRIAWLFQQAAA